MPDHKQNDTLQPFLSPAAAWALAVGTSVGWGSLVVTSNTYLAQAGPAGSILGLLIGLVTMFCISSVVGFLYVAAVSTVIGMLLYRNSMKVIINK